MANILITGANRGIGAEMAKQMVKAGHQVIGTSRVVSDDLGNWHDWLTLDVTDPTSLAAFKAAIADKNIDLLVCNSGVYLDKDHELDTGHDAGSWAATMAVNVAGTFATIQALLPNLRRSSGKIAVISSLMGSNTRASGGGYIYRASKAAVTNLVSNLALDLKSENIAIGAYHPGWVVTDMGGSDADIDVETSATGLLQRFDALSIVTSGTFESYDGEKLPY